MHRYFLKSIAICTLLLLMIASAEARDMVQSQNWRYFDDGVMGGVSDGSMSLGPNGELSLSGTVSTQNNGGFIQAQTPLTKGQTMGATGLSFHVKGNGKTYFIHLRNRATRLPWHYYTASFDTSDTWQKVILPFEAFGPSSGFLPTSLNADTLKSIGLVAYGSDHRAQVVIKDLQLY